MNINSIRPSNVAEAATPSVSSSIEQNFNALNHAVDILDCALESLIAHMEPVLAKILPPQAQQITGNQPMTGSSIVAEVIQRVSNRISTLTERVNAVKERLEV